MNVLITGGSGRLAGYVVEEFADQNLFLTDVVPPPDDRSHLPFLPGDLTDIEACRSIIAESRPSVIVALGAIPWPTDRGNEEARRKNPLPFDTTMQVNVMGLYYLMTAAAEAGVQAVIQTSSIVSILSRGTEYRYLPVDDDHPGCTSDSYVFSKIAGEMMLAWFSRAYDMQTLCCRSNWIWTPEQLKEHAATITPTQKWANPDVWHYVDIRDIAHAHRLIFDSLDCLPSHDAYIISAADHRAPENSRDLVEKFRPELLSTIPINLSGRQAFTSSERAKTAFGYEARYSWTDWS